MEPLNQYDDSAKGGYTYEEKLKLVAEGNMDPKEIGLASQEQAEEIVPKIPKIGDYLTFECSEVPIGIRAGWALKDQKIQPANPRGWQADWIENCKDHLIQGLVRTGNQKAILEQRVSEPVAGMIVVMRQAADIIEEKYEELKGTSTRDNGEQKANE